MDIRNNVCIGLDNVEFERAGNLIKILSKDAGYFKANLAFWLNRMHQLKYISELCKFNNSKFILDGKFNDIPNTMREYAKFAYKTIKADSCTVNVTTCGGESLQYFTDFEDKLTFILLSPTEEKSILNIKIRDEYVFYAIFNSLENEQINKKNIGFVAEPRFGDTLPFFEQYEEISLNRPYLVPGVGAQGYKISDVNRLKNLKYRDQTIINLGRSVVNSENPEESLKEFCSQIMTEMV